MELNYSFVGIPPLFFPGDLPFPDMRGTEKVKVSLSGSSTGPFPREVLTLGDLLCHQRPQPDESAITLLLDFQSGVTPPATGPIPVNKWTDVPNTPIYGQIRIALTREAIDQIRKVSSADYAYELALENVHFVDVTKPARA